MLKHATERMYKTSVPQGMPVSIEERLQTGDLRHMLNTPQDYCCPECWEAGELGELINGECLIHGKVKPMPKRMLAFSPQTSHLYEEYLEQIERRVQEMENKNSSKAIVQRPSKIAALTPDRREVDELAQRILYSIAGIQDTFGPQAHAAARALAQVAAVYQLDPVRDVFIIPTRFETDKEGRRIAVSWTLQVGYRGMDRGARRAARAEGGFYVFGSPVAMSEVEIIERRAHICSRCGGTGKIFGRFKEVRTEDGRIEKRQTEYPCDKCNGAKEFPPKEVVGVKIPLYVTTDKQAADELGVPYEPIWGIGIWQPGDGIPTARDAFWKAAKRARVDALNQRFSLPFIYSEEVDEQPEVVTVEPVVMEEKPAERPSLPQLVNLANLKYDDLQTLQRIIAKALEMGYEDESEVLDALTLLGYQEIKAEEMENIVTALKQHITPTVMPFDEPVERAEKAQVRKQLVALGYPEISHAQLLKVLCGKDCDWRTITRGQVSIVLGYAQAAAAAREQLPEGFASLEKYKEFLKEKANRLAQQKSMWE